MNPSREEKNAECKAMPESKPLELEYQTVEHGQYVPTLRGVALFNRVAVENPAIGAIIINANVDTGDGQCCKEIGLTTMGAKDLIEQLTMVVFKEPKQKRAVRLGVDYFKRDDLKKAIQSRVADRVNDKMEPVPRPQGYDLWRWPEFIALAKRLGIDLELPTEDLVIEIPVNNLVKIYQTYHADDIDQQDAVSPFDTVDTSTVHNEVFRTHAPKRRRDKQDLETPAEPQPTGLVPKTTEPYAAKEYNPAQPPGPPNPPKGDKPREIG